MKNAAPHDVDEDGRCTRSDLPADQCAAPRCRPDVTIIEDVVVINEALLPSQISQRMKARHVSIVSCGHHAYPSMIIARGPHGWVCDSCDPASDTRALAAGVDA